MSHTASRRAGALRRAHRALSFAALLSGAFVLAAPALAQQASITGIVVDGAYGGGLPGASVSVITPGTGELVGGSATDIDGRYRVVGVPEGTYDVTFSFTGYATQRVTGVAAAGELTLDIVLQEEVLELGAGEEVVVTADAVLDNDAALLRVRQRSAAVSDAVGAREISRAGAGNAADAMERVTGASVVGGRYVVVRGLGDRYASTQLNGAELPTADPDRRAVQFDLFPSDFLESITTLKTFTPDRPGNFSGGLVDITTRSFPDRLSVSLSTSTGFGTQSAPGEGVLRDPAASVNLFAAGGAGLGLPDGLTMDGGIVPREGDVLFDEAGARELDRLTRHFTEGRPIAPRVGEAQPNLGFGLSIGNRIPFFGNQLGFVVGVTSDRGTTNYDIGTVGRFDVVPRAGVSSPRLRSLRQDSRATQEASLGGIANFAYRVGARHEFAVNTLFTRAAESEARLISGLAPLPIGSEGDSIQVIDRVLGYTERSLASGQLRGRHRLDDVAGLDIEWRANYSQTAHDEPDRRYFANSLQFDEDGTPFHGTGGGSLDNALHYYRTLDENLAGAAVDVTLPAASFPFGLPVQVKVGGLLQHSDRQFRERRLEVGFGNGLFLGGTDAASVEEFFGAANSGIVEERLLPDGRTRYSFGHRLIDTTDPRNRYDGTLDVGAGYAMAEFPLLRRLRAIGGARYERTDLRVSTQIGDSLAASGELGGALVANDLLPSLNLVYGLTDDMNVRFAATKTIARPTFREISPFSSFDFATDAPLTGNPELRRTLISNVDVRWEWFNAPGAILAVSGYYKYLANPIERVIIDFENGTTRFDNVNEAEIYGLEVEARQRLGSLGRTLDIPFVRDLTLGGNVTLASSTITIDPEELAERRLVDPASPATRPLQGQSPYLLNLDVAYDDIASGTAVGLYYNVFGPRLSRVGAGAVDVLEQSSPQLDLIASHRLPRGLSLKLSIKNLFGRGVREVYDFPEAGLPSGQEAVYQAYDRGTAFSLGLTFSPRFDAAGVSVPPIPDASPLGDAGAPDEDTATAATR